MTALHVVVALLAGYLVLLLLLWIGQSRLVYHPGIPSRAVTSTPAAAGLAHEPVALTTADGETLAAWFVPGPGGDAPAVLFLHGNAGNIGHRIETLELLHAAGAATLILDYRGFGDSTGTPGERGTYRDAQAGWDWLTAGRGIAPDRIVIFGRSLGGAIAAWLAARNRPAALVLESAFTSIEELGAHHYPWAPVRLLNRFGYDTASELRRVESPTLVVHARDDEIVPFAHAERLAAIRPPVVELIELDGRHNDGMFASYNRYRDALAAFIAEHASATTRNGAAD